MRNILRKKALLAVILSVATIALIVVIALVASHTQEDPSTPSSTETSKETLHDAPTETKKLQESEITPSPEATVEPETVVDTKEEHVTSASSPNTTLELEVTTEQIEVPTKTEIESDPSDINHESVPNEAKTEEPTSSDQKGKVNPFDYIEGPLFSGHNGTGAVSLQLNTSCLIDYLLGEEPEDSESEEYRLYRRLYIIYSDAILDIDIHITPKDDLSNGDNIKVDITVPEILADKVMNASKTYAVLGLPELRKIDILPTVDYSGISGKAIANISFVTEPDYLTILNGNYNVEPNRLNWSNGDQLTITLTQRCIERLANEYNVVPTKTSWTVTVAGLWEYVTSPDQLPMEEVGDIATQYLATIEANYNGYDMFTAESFALEGIFWLTDKEDASFWGPKNLRLAIEVSHVEYYIAEGTSEKVRYVLAFKKNDLLADPNGIVTLSDDAGTEIANTIEQLEEYYIVTKIG